MGISQDDDADGIGYRFVVVVVVVVEVVVVVVVVVGVMMMMMTTTGYSRCACSFFWTSAGLFERRGKWLSRAWDLFKAGPKLP